MKRLFLGVLTALLLLPAGAGPVAASTVQDGCYGAHGRVVNCSTHPKRYVCLNVTRQLVEKAGWLEIGQ